MRLPHSVLHFPCRFSEAELASGAFIATNTTPLHALNLTARGITSIAPNGLDCYLTTDPASDDDGAFEPTHTQAVMLDHNELTTVPPLSVFGGVSVVTLRSNRLSGELSQDIFTTFARRYLVLDMSNNSFSSLQNATFSTFPGNWLRVELFMNNITELPQMAFGDYQGNFLWVNLASNKINTLATTTFVGFDTMVLSVNLANNAIATLSPGTIGAFQGQTLNINLAQNGMRGELPTGKSTLFRTLSNDVFPFIVHTCTCSFGFEWQNSRRCVVSLRLVREFFLLSWKQIFLFSWALIHEFDVESESIGRFYHSDFRYFCGVSSAGRAFVPGWQPTRLPRCSVLRVRGSPSTPSVNI